jgi:hypothetical protein
METKTLADLIIKEIKKNDILSSPVFGGDEMKNALSEFNRIYEQIISKMFVFNIQSNTKFVFIKRVIRKLIRIFTNRQTEFNYKIIELIKAQQFIILKCLESFEQLASTNDNNQNK